MTDAEHKKRSESAKRRGMPESVREQGRAAKLKSPRGARAETNSCAAEWHIKAPSGEEYRFRNMRHFVRNHADLFGVNGTDEECQTILTRFSVLRHNLKKGKQHTCLGGWTIIIDD